MNSILVSGHIGNIEIRPPKKQGGQPMLIFSVADNQFLPGQERSTVWWRCKLWGEKAGRFASLLNKGTYVAIAGRLSEDNYTDRSGKEHKGWQVWVDQIDLKNDRIRMDAPIKHDPAVVPLDGFEGGFDDDQVPF